MCFAFIFLHVLPIALIMSICTSYNPPWDIWAVVQYFHKNTVIRTFWNKNDFCLPDLPCNVSYHSYVWQRMQRMLPRSVCAAAVCVRNAVF